MKLIFLPDISFFKSKKDSKFIKNFQSFLKRINRLFPNSNLVSNLECVLLKKKIKNKSKNFRKLHAENSFAKFLKNNQILNICLANNHSFDFGEKGFEQMTKYLDKENINYFGGGKNLNYARKPLILKSKEKSLAIFGLSYKPEASKSKAGVLSLKKKSTLSYIKKFKKRNKDFFIVAYCHSGLELFEYPLKRDEIFYKKLIDIGCDVIVGSHPHRIQGLEKYKKKYIFYSIGDLFFNNVGRNDWIRYLTPPAHAHYYKGQLKSDLLFRSLLLEIDCIKGKINVYKVKRNKDFKYSINKMCNSRLDIDAKKFKRKLNNYEIIEIRKNIEKKILHAGKISKTN
jgi:hypothetical protein